MITKFSSVSSYWSFGINNNNMMIYSIYNSISELFYDSLK